SHADGKSSPQSARVGVQSAIPQEELFRSAIRRVLAVAAFADSEVAGNDDVLVRDGLCGVARAVAQSRCDRADRKFGQGCGPDWLCQPALSEPARFAEAETFVIKRDTDRVALGRRWKSQSDSER